MTYYNKQRMESFKRAMFAAQLGDSSDRPIGLADAGLEGDWRSWLSQPLTAAREVSIKWAS